MARFAAFRSVASRSGWRRNCRLRIKGYRYEIDPLDAQVLTFAVARRCAFGHRRADDLRSGVRAGIVTFTAAGGQPTRCYMLLTATRSDGRSAITCSKSESIPRCLLTKRRPPRRLGLGPL